MNRTMQSSVLSVIGAVTITAVVTGMYTNFVKPGLRWYLVAAGVLLLAMGIYGVLTARSEAGEHDPDAPPGEAAPDGHDHTHGPRVGWLLLVPFLLLGFVVPPPLGSFAAGRDDGQVRASSDNFDITSDLPEGQVVDMSMTEYQTRALYDESHSLKDRTVRLVGFVAEEKGGGWSLARMKLSCCAADAYSVKVTPVGGQQLAKDTWIAVTGTWEPSPEPKDENDFVPPRIKVESMEEVEEPDVPYE